MLSANFGWSRGMSYALDLTKKYGDFVGTTDEASAVCVHRESKMEYHESRHNKKIFYQSLIDNLDARVKSSPDRGLIDN